MNVLSSLFFQMLWWATISHNMQFASSRAVSSPITFILAPLVLSSTWPYLPYLTPASFSMKKRTCRSTGFFFFKGLTLYLFIICISCFPNVPPSSNGSQGYDINHIKSYKNNIKRIRKRIQKSLTSSVPIGFCLQDPTKGLQWRCVANIYWEWISERGCYHGESRLSGPH